MINNSTMPICPNCGSKSLYFGIATTTAMYFQPFSDESGRLHHHNGNTTNQEYVCKKCNTRFTKQIKNECWCGWGA